MNQEGKQSRISAYINDKDGIRPRDIKLICERWVQWFHIFLNAKSPKLDENIAEGVSKNMPLRNQPTMQEMADAIFSLVNRTAIGPDVVSIELFKFLSRFHSATEIARYRRLYLEGGEVPQQWKDAIIMVPTKRRIGQRAVTTGVSRW